MTAPDAEATRPPVLALRRRLGRLRRSVGAALSDAAWQAAATRARRRNGLPEWTGTVAMNMRPARGPWGGGSQWVVLMSRYLVERGYRVQYDLAGPVDCIVLVEPRDFPTTAFGVDDIRAYRRRHPGTACVHRINEGGAHKSTREIDDILRDANEVADATVFLSEWLRDYHAAHWFATERLHRVIYNGADASVFHPVRRGPLPAGPLRLVTHHWSANRRKGYDEYERLDALIADGTIPDAELWVIGRWPEDVRWRTARTFPPARGPALADLLRQCHLYVTASRWEAGGMHHVEGAQCGLPVVYHADGGGIVEAARRYGVEFRDDVAGAVAEARARYGELRGRVLDDAPSGDRMCLEYFHLIQRLIADRVPHASAL